MKGILKLIVAALAGAIAPAATAVDVCFTHGDGYGPTECFGTGAAETYDVAMKVSSATVGEGSLRTIGIRVPDHSDISDVSIWLSSSLRLDGGVNAPDMGSYSVTPVDGWAEITLPDIKLDEKGLYVGYSFKVKDVTDDTTADPVIVRRTSATEALWVHTPGRYRKWTDVGAQRGLALAADITVSGDFPEARLEVGSPDGDIDVLASQSEIGVPVTLTNYGASAVGKMKINATANGAYNKTFTLNITPEYTLYYGQPFPTTLYIRQPDGTGLHKVEIEIPEVNGLPNTADVTTATADVYNYDYLPVRRPLFEEYTGLWCNYCPKGFAAMEHMQATDSCFIGVCFHTDDRMAAVPFADYPSPVPTHPYGYIDRDWDVDVYSGRRDGGFIGNDMVARREVFSPLEISVDARRSDADAGVIEVSAPCRFVKSLTGDYRAFFYLVADGLSDPAWRQANAYAGDDPSHYIPEMRQFCEGGTQVSGLVFNDVVVMASDTRGIAGSLPSKIEAGSPLTVSYTFDTRGVTGLKGTDLIGMASKLWVVAGVADASTGRVLNAAKCRVAAPGGLGQDISDFSVTDVRHYDVFGRPTDPAAHGVVITLTTYSDGRTAVTKKSN